MKRKNKQEYEEAMKIWRLKLYGVMMQHIGPDKRIGMGELFEDVIGEPWSHRINDTKLIRKLVTEMRREGHPVMSDTSSSHGGYWLAASASEINNWCNQSKNRALDILQRISTIKKISLPEFLGQMQIELGGKS